MRELGGGKCFAMEAVADRLARAGDLAEEFKRDRPMELGVLGLVDDAHRAAGDLAGDPVLSYRRRRSGLRLRPRTHDLAEPVKRLRRELPSHFSGSPKSNFISSRRSSSLCTVSATKLVVISRNRRFARI